MKTKRKLFFVFLIFILSLCGCGKKAPEKEPSQETSTPGKFIFSPDVEWYDNSLDTYSALSPSLSLAYEPPSDALDGGASMSTLSNSGAASLKKHLFEDSSKCWDEIVYSDGTKQKKSICIAEGLDRQVWGIGSFATQAHYLLLRTEKNDDDSGNHTYVFSELNEQMQEINTIPISFLSPDSLVSPLSIIVDANSYIHMIAENFNTSEKDYYIISFDGTTLQKIALNEEAKNTLIILQDGSVALHTKDEVYIINPTNGEKKTLEDLSIPCNSCTTFQQDKILWANNKGIYQREKLSGKDTTLYEWSNHGISVSEVVAIQGFENQGIHVLYSNSKGYHYLYLEPTTQDIEIQEITFAVSNDTKALYQNVVAEFNRQYPAYRIVLKKYEYEDMKLSSEMIAGEGPVILDSDLMNFENQVKYWEPLDNVFAQMNMDNELILEAINLGKIDGTLYGIVSTFSIRTVLTGRKEPHNWDYQAFLQCIQESASLEGIFNGNTLDEGEAFITLFFIHGMDDNFLFDSVSKTTSFDTENFRTILQLGKQYQGKRCGFDKLKDGTLLCLTAEITKPEQIAFIRVLLGEDANYIGYPSKNGSSHYLYTSSPLVIRNSATETEKIVAHTFLKLLLSYDAQKEFIAQNSMSIRWDVLDQQIWDINIFSDSCIYGMPQIYLDENQIDYEKDANTLYKLLQTAKPYKYIPREFYRIILEEISPYFSGDVSEDTAISNLESRVGLYLQEQP